MNNRSPHLFPHIVARNLQPPTAEIPAAVTPNHSSDLQFMRSWAECDPGFDEDVIGHPLNRWTVLGIAIVIVASGAFWTGVGFVINYLLK